MFFGIDLVEAIQVISYPGIFAIILAESGLFFAIYLPGGSLLFTAGLLASQGILSIWILLATVITAAVLGDTIGYWFGAWVGPALYRRKNSRFLKQEHLQQTRLFFEEHGAKTVLLARFVPIVRTFAPILAGVGNMNYSTFLFYNVLGALLWGGGFTLAGYFLGEAIPDIEHSLEYIVLAIVAVTMLPLVHHVWKMRKAGANATPSLPDDRHAPLFSISMTRSRRASKNRKHG
jgi:membrane-associated protein